MADDGWDQFADVARAMSAGTTLEQTLDRAVTGAVDLIDGCDHAGISVVHRRKKIDTPAASDDVVRRGDELQYTEGEGPCLQSIVEQETVQSHDLTTETRWPRWSGRVAEELGVRSMLCLQLFVTHDSLGALNLYSDRVNGFDAHDRATGLALAAHVAVAMTAAQTEQHLETAIVNRTVIGQAEGMLMERYSLTPEQAFAVLRRASQHSNQKLSVVAADLVRDGIHAAARH